MELVELYGQRESAALSLVKPADRQSARLADLVRSELEKQGKRVPKASKRRVSTATRIGVYTEPKDLEKIKVDLGAHVFSVAIHHPLLDERGNSSGEPFVACGCGDGSIHFLSLTTGERILRTIDGISREGTSTGGHKDAVTCMQVYQPAETALLVIISGSRDSTVRITIVESGRTSGVLKGHDADVWCLQVLEQADVEPLVISGGLDGKICIWSMLEHTLLNTLVADAGPIYCLSIIAHSDIIESCPLIFAGSRDKKVRMWSLVSGSVVQEFTGHTDRITCLEVISPPNALIHYRDLSALDKAAQLIQSKIVAASRLFASSKKKAEQELTKEDEDLLDFMKVHAAMQDDLNILSRDVFVISGCEDGSVRIFHAMTGLLVRTLITEDRSPVYSISLNLKEMKENVVDTEPMLAVSSKSGKVQLWHLDCGRIMRTLQPHEAPILCMSMATTTSKVRANTAETANAPPVTVVVTGSADKSVLICLLHSYLDEAIDAYEMDQKERLPRAVMQRVPEKFAKWPRVYLLSQKFGSMDEFFAGDNFRLFAYAMDDERPDFLSTFLTHASTGLLISSRAAAVARAHVECLKMQKQREHVKAANALTKTKTSWFSPRVCMPSWLLYVLKLPQYMSTVSALLRKTEAVPDEGKSLLEQAVDKKDALVVRALLDAWREMVMEPPRDLLEQTAGPAMCLSKSDLVLVSKVFPMEFENYICSLRLVHVHSHISLACTQNLLPKKKSKEAAGRGIFLEDVAMWRKEDSQSQEPLTSLYLPLRQAADPEMVLAYIKTSEQLHSVRIFDSEVGVVSNHYAWGKHGMRFHRVSVLWYLFDCFCFVIFVTASGKKDDNNPVQKLRSAAVYFMSSYVVGRFTTVCQQYSFGARLSGNFNKLSFMSMLKGVGAWGIYECVWYIVRTITSYSKEANPILFSICSLIQWGKLLYYFRAFESTGLLIAMILQIISEIKFYLFVISLIYFFFTQSLWVLNSNDLSHPLKSIGDDHNDATDDALRYAVVGNAFGDQRSSFLTAFTFMFGNFQPAFFFHLDNLYIRRWAIFVSIIFMMTICILMFNLLIAFMSDIFVRMSERGVAQWRLMQAKTMHESGFEIASHYSDVDQMHIVSPKIIHVLKRTSDINMDQLKASFEGADSESTSDRIIRVAEQISTETTGKIVANEKVVLDRLAAQRIQLEEMLLKIEELTARPNDAKTDSKI